MINIVGVIPAKGTSSRVPSKNKQEILGVPLYLWAANNLLRVMPREHVFVDSDCDEILSRAKSHGFGTIKRRAELATNATGGNELMHWAASNVDAEIYVQHLPPMIFLRAETLRKAIGRVEHGATSSFGVYKTHQYRWNSEAEPAYDIHNIPNSVTLPLSIVEGMGIYVTRREALLGPKKRIVQPWAMVELDNFERIDIDTPPELEYARTVAKGLGYDTPYTTGIRALRPKFRPKLLIVDIDGVLTDGGMYYSECGDEMKKFNTRDGIATKHAVSSGIPVAFLSSGINRNLIQSRASLLGVDLVHVGKEPKTEILREWCANLDIDLSDIAFIGDDVNDIEVMRQVGFTACPQDAVSEIKSISSVILSTRGGGGCLRELVDNHIEMEKTP